MATAGSSAIESLTCEQDFSGQILPLSFSAPFIAITMRPSSYLRYAMQRNCDEGDIPFKHMYLAKKQQQTLQNGDKTQMKLYKLQWP